MCYCGGIYVYSTYVCKNVVCTAYVCICTSTYVCSTNVCRYVVRIGTYVCMYQYVVVYVSYLLSSPLQLIAFIDTLLNEEATGIRHVLIIVPKNTLSNWIDEFKHWTGDDTEYSVSP